MILKEVFQQYITLKYWNTVPKMIILVFEGVWDAFTECLQIQPVLLDGEGRPNQISHLICSLFFVKVHFYPKFPLEDNESC